MQTADFPDRLIARAPDHAFVVSLVYGVVKMRRPLEWLLSHYLRKKSYGTLEASLLTGAYQLFYMPEIPPYAVLNTTVEAAKQSSKESTGLVNAVLRQLLNNREKLLAQLNDLPLALRLSHPDHLVARWLERYGAEQTETLCAWNNTPADIVLALLPHNGVSVPDYIRLAADAGILLSPHPAAPTTHLLVPHGAPRLDTFPGYDRGLFIVQDLGSLACVELLDIRPGLTVLDACAAPGGKTLQIASRMIPPGETTLQGLLIAAEKHEDRLAFLRDNITRSGITGIEILHTDAATENNPQIPEGAQKNAQIPNSFDRILLDLPCSNTGVFRRRPDARWRHTPKRTQQLLAQQRLLLAANLQRLAPGGRLVYSTCSIEPEENLQLVESLLAVFPEFQLLRHHEQLPFIHHTDGMFAAVIQRRLGENGHSCPFRPA